MNNNQNKIERNLDMWKKKQKGWSLTKLGSFFGCSKQNCSRICQNWERDHKKVGKNKSNNK